MVCFQHFRGNLNTGQVRLLDLDYLLTFTVCIGKPYGHNKNFEKVGPQMKHLENLFFCKLYL